MESSRIIRLIHLLCLILLMASCNGKGSEPISVTETVTATPSITVVPSASPFPDTPTIILPSETPELESLLETRFPSSGISNSPATPPNVTDSAVSLTPDVVATNHADFLILNGTPQSAIVSDVEFSMAPTDDLTDIIVTLSRPDQQPQHVSVAETVYQGGLAQVPLSAVSLVAFQDLDLQGEPELVFEVDTYGIRCCVTLFVLYYDRSLQQYSASNSITRYWAHTPHMIDIDGGGQPEFVTRNGPFTFEQPGGDAAVIRLSPIQILRFADGRLIDVTHEYPDLLTDDANFWWFAFTKQDQDFSQTYRDLMLLTGNDFNYWREQSLCGAEIFAVSAYIADLSLLNQEAIACQMLEGYYNPDIAPLPNCQGPPPVLEQSCSDYVTMVNEWLEKTREEP